MDRRPGLNGSVFMLMGDFSRCFFVSIRLCLDDGCGKMRKSKKGMHVPKSPERSSSNTADSEKQGWSWAEGTAHVGQIHVGGRPDATWLDMRKNREKGDAQATPDLVKTLKEGGVHVSLGRDSGEFILNSINGDGKYERFNLYARRDLAEQAAERERRKQETPGEQENDDREVSESIEDDAVEVPLEGASSEAASQLDMNQPLEEVGWGKKLEDVAAETEPGSWTGQVEREANEAEQREAEDAERRAYEKKHGKELKAQREQAERDEWYEKLKGINESGVFRPGDWMSHEEKVAEGLIRDYKTGEDYQTAQAKKERERNFAENGEPHIAQYIEFETPKDVWEYTMAANRVAQYERETLVGSQNLQGNFKADEDNSPEALRSRLLQEHWKWVEKVLATDNVIRNRELEQKVYAEYLDYVIREGHEGASFMDFLNNSEVYSTIKPTADAAAELNEARMDAREDLKSQVDVEGKPYYTEDEVNALMRVCDKTYEEVDETWKRRRIYGEVKKKARPLGGLASVAGKFIGQMVRKNRRSGKEALVFEDESGNIIDLSEREYKIVNGADDAEEEVVETQEPERDKSKEVHVGVWIIDLEQLIPTDKGIEQLVSHMEEAQQMMEKYREEGDSDQYYRWKQIHLGLSDNISLSVAYQEVQRTEDQKRADRLAARKAREQMLMKNGEGMEPIMALNTLLQWSRESDEGGKIPNFVLHGDQPLLPQLQAAADLCQKKMVEELQKGDDQAARVWQDRLRTIQIAGIPYLNDDKTTFNMVMAANQATA